MLPLRFCNYNLDYQQRLGFLKLMVQVCDGIRGGPDQFKHRLRQLYRSTIPGRALFSSQFDPKSLLEREDIPSWQPGISKERLDRLVLWGEMIGLVVNGRLSEWARILRLIGSSSESIDQQNPFRLSTQERAFFVQLLFYHDQVLPYLIRRLARYPVNTQFTVWEACLDTTEAIGSFYDGLGERGSAFERVQLKHVVRDLLGRIATQYGLREQNRLASSPHRALALEELRRAKPGKLRAHLAEYHAVCRFEQLTDLGLLTKDPPDGERTDKGRESRRLWQWYVPERLLRAAPLIPDSSDKLEGFLSSNWIAFCGMAMNLTLRTLDPLVDQRELAALLDATLPSARRQLGPVQIHSWAILACIEALQKGCRLEIGNILSLFDAMHHHPAGNEIVRQAGGGTFLTRTAFVSRLGLSSFFDKHTIELGGSSHGRA